ncbi:diguanylate cyclase [Candidatus Woesearchaeota archaeon]|nr:diguanylate cyclase [Candidatus Woesearchaeota archaeon]
MKICDSARATILIIDDYPENIEVMGDHLAGDYEIQFALSGAEGLELVDKNTPDLILLDMMMPVMDGFEVCRRLRENPRTREIPVIFVTARNDSETESRALAAGAVDFIHKPVNPPVLRARVDTHIKLKMKLDELRNLATFDALTGLVNRRVFHERLEMEWNRAMRHHDTISLLMIDVDYFKPYNDHYGHPQGDECLARLARTIGTTVLRANELAARFGGEEFVVLMANTTLEHAARVAERICQRVRDLAIPHEYSSVSDRVTVSIGVGCAIPCRTVERPVLPVNDFDVCTKLLGCASHLVEMTDQALYEAKRQGRDRFVCTGPLPPRECYRTECPVESKTSCV